MARCAALALLTAALLWQAVGGMQDVAGEAMIAWLQSQGVDTSAVTLQTHAGQRTLLTLRDTPPGTAISVPARVCMTYAAAELHSVIGEAVLAEHRRNPGGGASLWAVAALLHYETFVAPKPTWGALVGVLPRQPDNLPYLWRPAHRALLELAGVSLGHFSSVWAEADAAVQRVVRGVVRPLHAHYADAVDEEELLPQLRWAVATVLARAQAAASPGGSLALCPLLDLPSHAPAAPPVIPHEGQLQSLSGGQRRAAVVAFSLQLPPGAAGQEVHRAAWPGVEPPCAQAVLARLGLQALPPPACFGVQVSVPAPPDGAPAVTAFRASALAAAGFLPNATTGAVLEFSLPAGAPQLPRDLLRLLRLLQLTWSDAHVYEAADSAGQLVSLRNELGALRSLRDALRGSQARYQAALVQLVQRGALPAQQEALHTHQRAALAHNSDTMAAASGALRLVDAAWAAILSADERELGA